MTGVADGRKTVQFEYMPHCLSLLRVGRKQPGRLARTRFAHLLYGWRRCLALSQLKAASRICGVSELV